MYNCNDEVYNKIKGGNHMKSKTYSIIYWSSRILSLLLVAFVFLFSLDVFEIEASFWNLMLGFLMHNIPVIILLISIIIGWKMEIIPSITFLIGTIILIIINTDGNFDSIIYGLPIVIPGIAVSVLYFLSWFYKKKVI